MPRSPLSRLSIFLIVLLDVTQTYMCGNRLERNIANFASLNQWLATIRNNRIQWSMNLKNIAKTLSLMVKRSNRIFDEGKLKKIKTLKNHEKQSETMKR